MGAKHTTARLEVVGNLVRTGLESGGFLVAECRDANGDPYSDEAKANAELFAAAPELLKALIAMREQFRYTSINDGDDDANALARAAIAKATGEQA